MARLDATRPTLRTPTLPLRLALAGASMAGMTQPDHQAAHRKRAERAAFDKLVERIKSQFPEMDEQTVVATVRGEYGRFETSPIRDFLPILVERSVRHELAHHRA